MDGKSEGLEIVGDGGHRTRLKWHQLRRSRQDRLFSTDVLAEGLRLGASMELDLSVRADGGFVVLHDDLLEGETTGAGRVSAHGRAEMERLTLHDGSPLLFSEELAGLLAAGHPDALLQFDLKDDLQTIGDAGFRHLARCFADLPCRVIVGAYDIDLIVAARQRIPHFARGIDPTPRLERLLPDWAAVEAELIAGIEGPSAPEMVYLAWPLVLHAAEHGVDCAAICRARGVRLDAWTFNLADSDKGFDETEWKNFSALMALRPDQITTDDSRAVEREWIRRRGC
jgi:glycerophosphoryl diester phosphodiesterase